MTQTILLTWTDVVQHVVLRKFPSRADAVWASEELVDPARTAHVVSSEEDLHDRHVFGSQTLVRVYNALTPDKPITKFETLEVGRRRVFQALVQAAAALPLDSVRQVEKLPEASPVATKPATKPIAARRPSKMTIPKPPKPVTEFKQVREGTDRARVLRVMNGGYTVSQAANLVGMTPKYLLAHAYCLHRDIGIGYTFEDDKIRVIFPQSKTLADAIKA